MAPASRLSLSIAILSPLVTVLAQQNCYLGPGGAPARGPAGLVPCENSGYSACCLLGDTCLSGNACYNYATGNTYQYGCSDPNYLDASCPHKCGFNTTKSPWTAIQFCGGVPDVEDTWVCDAPESCGCQWNATYDLLQLPLRGCRDMGDTARVALYAPPALAPYVSLPSVYGGETSYYSGTTVDGTSTWISTALRGYTPASIGPLTTYSKPAPTTDVELFPDATPAPSTLHAAVHINATVTPVPNGVWSGSTVIPTDTTQTSDQSLKTEETGAGMDDHSSGGLSTGAKVGVGVGVAGGVVLLVAIAGACVFFRRRRRQRELSEQQETKYGPYAEQAHQSWPGPGPIMPMPGHARALSYPDSPHASSYNPPSPFLAQTYSHQGPPAVIHEADSSQATRSVTSQPPAELTADSQVQELDSTSSPRTTPAPAYEHTDIAKR